MEADISGQRVEREADTALGRLSVAQANKVAGEGGGGR